MRNTNKKGFTIVELVIVVAVIAILAAVLIPTFSGIIARANLSADQQAVRQMNTALAVYEAENGVPANVKEAKKALDEQLVNVEGGLTPVTKGYAYYWDSAKNEVVLVATGDTVQNGWELLTSNAYGEEYTVASADEIKAAVSAAANEPVYIKLTSNVTIDTVEVTSGAVYLDLNGKTLSSTNTGGGVITSQDGANVTITNGTIEMNTTRATDCGIYANNATLTLNNVEVLGTTISARGFADLSIVDCEINADDQYYGVATNSSTVENDGARISIVRSTITAEGEYATPVTINIYSSVTIDDCVLNGNIYGLVLRGNNANVKNTEINVIGWAGQYVDGTPGFGQGTQKMPSAAIVLNAQTGYNYNSNYTFSNVTVNKGSSTYNVATGAWNGYTVTVSGITVDKDCNK